MRQQPIVLKKPFGDCVCILDAPNEHPIASTGETPVLAVYAQEDDPYHFDVFLRPGPLVAQRLPTRELLVLLQEHTAPPHRDVQAAYTLRVGTGIVGVDIVGGIGVRRQILMHTSADHRTEWMDPVDGLRFLWERHLIQKRVAGHKRMAHAS